MEGLPDEKITEGLRNLCHPQTSALNQVSCTHLYIGKYLFTSSPSLAYVRQFLIRLQELKHCILKVFCKINVF